MLTTILFIACIIFASGWLRNKIGLLTLTAYITKKGYAPPVGRRDEGVYGLCNQKSVT